MGIQLPFWSGQRKRPISNPRLATCLVFLPAVLARHMRKDEGVISFRISLITSPGVMLKCLRIASKLVRSSQAISMMRSISALDNPSRFECFIIRSQDIQFKQINKPLIEQFRTAYKMPKRRNDTPKAASTENTLSRPSNLLAPRTSLLLYTLMTYLGQLSHYSNSTSGLNRGTLPSQHHTNPLQSTRGTRDEPDKILAECGGTCCMNRDNQRCENKARLDITFIANS
jgi:hypothetical protein